MSDFCRKWTCGRSSPGPHGLQVMIVMDARGFPMVSLETAQGPRDPGPIQGPGHGFVVWELTQSVLEPLSVLVWALWAALWAALWVHFRSIKPWIELPILPKESDNHGFHSASKIYSEITSLSIFRQPKCIQISFPEKWRTSKPVESLKIPTFVPTAGFSLYILRIMFVKKRLYQSKRCVCLTQLFLADCIFSESHFANNALCPFLCKGPKKLKVLSAQPDNDLSTCILHVYRRFSHLCR